MVKNQFLIGLTVFRVILNVHVKQLQQILPVGEGTFVFRELARLPMYSFNIVCRIDNTSNIY
jgi:hypothetical protein